MSGSHMESEKWYSGLDDGIRFPVRVLHARGIETGQSCEGGEGHAYDHPSIDLSATPGAGFAALAALEEYGLRVRDVALLWTVDKGFPSECFWRVTLWQAWPDRADQQPMFVWSYEAQDQDSALANTSHSPLIPGPMLVHTIPIQECEWRGVNPLTGESFQESRPQ